MFSVIEGIDTFFMYIFVKIYFLHVVCQALQSSVFFFFFFFFDYVHNGMWKF